MIARYFVPSSWNNQRIVSEKILTVGHSSTSMYGALVEHGREKTTVLKIDTALFPDDTKQHATAFKSFIQGFGSYDTLRYLVPASKTLIKTLSVPLCGRDKIGMALNSELEEKLPFDVQGASTGFFINHEDHERQISSITCASIKSQILEQEVEGLASVNISPQEISPSSMGYIYLGEKLSAGNPQEPMTLVTIEEESSQILFFNAGKLLGIRQVRGGYHSIVEQIASATKLSREEVIKRLAQAPITKDSHDAVGGACYQALSSLYEKISFAVKAHYVEQQHEEGFGAMVIASPVLLHVATLKDRLTKESPIKKALYLNHTSALKQLGVTLNKPLGGSIWGDEISAVYSSLSQPLENQILLNTKHTIALQAKLVQNSLSISFGIFCITLAVIMMHGYRTIGALNDAVQTTEEAHIEKLTETFPEVFEDRTTPSSLDRAIMLVEDSESDPAFSSAGLSKIPSPLQVLQELVSIIDRRKISASVQKVHIFIDEQTQEPRITVEGLFTSETDSHFTDFARFNKHLTSSKHLVFASDTESSLAPEGKGVSFVARFKWKEG
jgi:hypothetical protein